MGLSDDEIDHFVVDLLKNSNGKKKLMNTLKKLEKIKTEKYSKLEIINKTIVLDGKRLEFVPDYSEMRKRVREFAEVII